MTPLQCWNHYFGNYWTFIAEAITNNHKSKYSGHTKSLLELARYRCARIFVEYGSRVGPDASKATVRGFDSLEELRNADREGLEGVYNVGEETAEAVLEHVRA